MKSVLVYIYFIFFTSLLLSFEVQANQVTFAATILEGSQLNNRSGYLDHILNEISRRSGEPVEYRVNPLARSMMLFRNKKRDCLLPGSSKEYFDKKSDLNIIRSHPYSGTMLLKFVRSDKGSLLDLYEYNGLRVGSIRDFNDLDISRLSRFSGVKHVISNSHEQLLTMLEFNRIQVALAWYPTFSLLSERLKKSIDFYKDQPISVDYMVISCHRTDKTEAFIEKINPVILDMWKDGTIIRMHPENVKALKEILPPPDINALIN